MPWNAYKQYYFGVFTAEQRRIVRSCVAGQWLLIGDASTISLRSRRLNRFGCAVYIARTADIILLERSLMLLKDGVIEGAKPLTTCLNISV